MTIIHQWLGYEIAHGKGNHISRWEQDKKNRISFPLLIRPLSLVWGLLPVGNIFHTMCRSQQLSGGKLTQLRLQHFLVRRNWRTRAGSAWRQGAAPGAPNSCFKTCEGLSGSWTLLSRAWQEGEGQVRLEPAWRKHSPWRINEWGLTLPGAVQAASLPPWATWSAPCCKDSTWQPTPSELPAHRPPHDPAARETVALGHSQRMQQGHPERLLKPGFAGFKNTDFLTSLGSG